MTIAAFLDLEIGNRTEHFIIDALRAAEACDLSGWFGVDGLSLPVECEGCSLRDWATETATLSRPRGTGSSSADDPVRGHCSRSSSRDRARKRLGSTSWRLDPGDRSGRVADCRSEPYERHWTAMSGQGTSPAGRRTRSFTPLVSARAKRCKSLSPRRIPANSDRHHGATYLCSRHIQVGLRVLNGRISPYNRPRRCRATEWTTGDFMLC